MGLARLPQFVNLFPGDQEVDRVRLSTSGTKPSLLVVEDNADDAPGLPSPDGQL